MSALLCGGSVLPIDIIRYQVSGVGYCSHSQHLNYCLTSALSAIMRIQYASCSPSNLGVCILQVVVFFFCDDLRTAAAVVLLLVSRLGLHSSSCSN